MYYPNYYFAKYYEACIFKTLIVHGEFGLTISEFVFLPTAREGKVYTGHNRPHGY